MYTIFKFGTFEKKELNRSVTPPSHLLPVRGLHQNGETMYKSKYQWLSNISGEQPMRCRIQHPLFLSDPSVIETFCAIDRESTLLIRL